MDPVQDLTLDESSRSAVSSKTRRTIGNVSNKKSLIAIRLKKGSAAISETTGALGSATEVASAPTTPATQDSPVASSVTSCVPVTAQSLQSQSVVDCTRTGETPSTTGQSVEDSPLSPSVETKTDPVYLTADDIISEGLDDEAASKLVWDMPLHPIGLSTDDIDPVFCYQCKLPILIYGRLIRCRHLFCYECAKTLETNCPKCSDTVAEVEKISKPSLLVCRQPFVVRDKAVVNKDMTTDESKTTVCCKGYTNHQDMIEHLRYRHSIDKPVQGRDWNIAPFHNPQPMLASESTKGDCGSNVIYGRQPAAPPSPAALVNDLLSIYTAHNTPGIAPGIGSLPSSNQLLTAAVAMAARLGADGRVRPTQQRHHGVPPLQHYLPLLNHLFIAPGRPNPHFF